MDQLLSGGIVLPEDWDSLDGNVRAEIWSCPDEEKALSLLVDLGLLTHYQATRVSAGKAYGLVLGNYRVLDRLGAGGMGTVYKGEHVELRRLVAIKVMPLTADGDPQALSRFFAEMQILGRLHHPNIVTAVDSGKVPGGDHHCGLRYFVMEYVPGEDLQSYVNAHGPLPVAAACRLIHQVAAALVETHQCQLVHRDIKPSNIVVTRDQQAKLLDFGLARRFDHRMTEPGTVLGTVDFMAPEQCQDASNVDIRCDLYGLGGTLYWCLTGQLPFPPTGTVLEEVAHRCTQAPPSVRALRPEIPEKLGAIVSQLLAVDPDDRFPSPADLIEALLPFLDNAAPQRELLRLHDLAPASPNVGPASHRILMVDDDASIRDYCREVLQGDITACDEAGDVKSALAVAAAASYDVVLLDVDLPDGTGADVLRGLREKPPAEHLKIIMLSGRSSNDDMAKMLLAGADDYLPKPFTATELRGKVKTAFRLKDAQDRSDLLTRHALAVNAELERNLEARASDLVHARNALVLALAKLVEQRDSQVGNHMPRMQRYCRVLAEDAAGCPAFQDKIDPPFIEMLECCAPLHDIGKVGLPDRVLLKAGELTPDERAIMEAHTTIGAETLAAVAWQHGFAAAFLQMAIDITRHHHERYDGHGYPDRLAGTEIPLAARIVAIADVYDGLRSRRLSKPPVSHSATMQLILEDSPGQFDPALVPRFQRCASQLERICRELPD
jgi:response regulator RpfG family c-di-GMP phosphodiesterase